MLALEQLQKVVAIWIRIGRGKEPTLAELIRFSRDLEKGKSPIAIGYKHAPYAKLYYNGKRDLLWVFPNLSCGEGNQEYLRKVSSIADAIEREWKKAGFKVRRQEDNWLGI